MSRTWAEQSLLERMVTAVERVRDRLTRATAALDAPGVPYALVGGNAVAAWVATVDPGAVRNTQDVDILLRREDLDAAERALAAAGFIRANVSGVNRYLDGPDARPRDAVHLWIAGEKVRPTSLAPAPDVTDSEELQNFRVLALKPLVRMELASFLLNDRVDLQDMLEVGLIDASWPVRFPADLGARLQSLIDTSDG
jgi:hypothetical protein